jgi:Domain of unknown function (DUF222)
VQCVIHSWRFVHRWRVAALLVSARTASVAHMFDTGLPGPEDLAGADDSLVIAAITGWACVEAAASARRLAAIAELVRRRAEGPTDCAQWSCDNWDSMAAEVAAALHVSHGMASGQMYLSVALRDRLPKVAALFVEGMLSARLVAAIVWRTDLITDEAALGLVDKTLADEAIRFGPLSVVKTNEAIDAIIDQYDPAALRRTPVGYTGGDANATYRNHGTHADAIEITCDPTPHRLPDARMPDGRHRRFGHRSRRCTTIRPPSFGVIKRPGVHRRHQPRRNRPRPVHLAGGRIPA